MKFQAVNYFYRASFDTAMRQALAECHADPNLILRITVETVNREILPGSHWKSKVIGAQKVVSYLTPDGCVMYSSPEGDGTGYCPRAEDWFRDNEWVKNP